MVENTWVRFALVARDNATIAEQILTAVANMKLNGSFDEGTSLCWNAAELELLAMFAIDAKRKLAR